MIEREEAYDKIKNLTFNTKTVKFPTKCCGCFVFDVVDGKVVL